MVKRLLNLMNGLPLAVRREVKKFEENVRPGMSEGSSAWSALFLILCAAVLCFSGRLGEIFACGEGPFIVLGDFLFLAALIERLLVFVAYHLPKRPTL